MYDLRGHIRLQKSPSLKPFIGYRNAEVDRFSRIMSDRLFGPPAAVLGKRCSISENMLTVTVLKSVVI